MPARPARLRRSRSDQPGIRRRRAGSGFAYYYEDGRRVTEVDVLARVKSLVIPPAWTDVWICPWPNGHVQALGTDAAGRRQYRYHDDWRLMRDAEKHERVLRMAAVLPALREQCGSRPRHRRPGAAASAGGRRPLARSRLLSGRRRGLRRRAQHLRSGNPAQEPRDPRTRRAGVRVRRQGRQAPGRHDHRSAGARGDRRIEAPPRWRRRVAGLQERGRPLVRRPKRRCERASTRTDRRRHDRQGFPHLARHCVDGGCPRRLATVHRPPAGHCAGLPRGRRLSGQHAGGLPEVVRRPAWWSSSSSKERRSPPIWASSVRMRRTVWLRTARSSAQ